jgi:hypothetical protein
MEVFLEEADLIRPERVGYCALHELDDPPTIQDPPEILGFRFSQCFCPRRTQLVVTLLETLLSKSHEGNSGGHTERMEPKRYVPYASEHCLPNLFLPWAMRF